MHENGFTKISLYRSGRGSQLRLHVWPAGHGDPSYHNHRWHFGSFILRGRLQVVNVQARRSRGGLSGYRLFDADENLVKKRRSLGRFTLDEVTSCSLGANDFHFSRSHQVHWVAAECATLSLMLAGPPIREYSEVYVREQTRSIRRRLSSDEIKALLAAMSDPERQ